MYIRFAWPVSETVWLCSFLNCEALTVLFFMLCELRLLPGIEFKKSLICSSPAPFFGLSSFCPVFLLNGLSSAVVILYYSPPRSISSGDGERKSSIRLRSVLALVDTLSAAGVRAVAAGLSNLAVVIRLCSDWLTFSGTAFRLLLWRRDKLLPGS